MFQTKHAFPDYKPGGEGIDEPPAKVEDKTAQGDKTLTTELDELELINADGNKVTLILVGTKSDKLFEGGLPQEEESNDLSGIMEES